MASARKRPVASDALAAVRRTLGAAVLSAICVAASAQPSGTATIPSAAPAATAASTATTASTGSPPFAVLGLAQLYRQALPHEARLKAAEAAFASSSELLPMARAQLRPALSASVNRARNRLENTQPNLFGIVNTTREDYVSFNQSLTLRQSVYRPGLTAAVRSAGHAVDSARAQRDQEFTNFAGRVSTAYFEALLAQGQLDSAREHVRSARVQLMAAQRGFSSGSGTRTDIDEMQAQLDLALADEVDAAQFLAYAGQQLAALVDGAAVQARPARMPAPEALWGSAGDDVRSWQQRARLNSAELTTLRAQLAGAEEEITRARAGHLPTVDLLLQRTRSANENVNRTNSSYENTAVALQLNVPIYSGGYVSAQTRQAIAERDKARFQLEALEADLDARVRREHRTVVEGLARHRALQQATVSARAALRSVERSFQAGVRTQVDIVRAAQRVALQERDALTSSYSTLNARLRLELLTAGQAAEVEQSIHWMDGLLH